MPNITILQADNRPQLNYLLLTQQVNKKACDYLDYKYLFVNLQQRAAVIIICLIKIIYNKFFNIYNLIMITQ